MKSKQRISHYVAYRKVEERENITRIRLRVKEKLKGNNRICPTSVAIADTRMAKRAGKKEKYVQSVPTLRKNLPYYIDSMNAAQPIVKDPTIVLAKVIEKAKELKKVIAETKAKKNKTKIHPVNWHHG